MSSVLQSERTSAIVSKRSPAVGGKITGTVASYGQSGNLVTDIPNESLAAAASNREVTVTCDEHQTIGIFAAGHPEEPCTLMAIRGEGGFLELTIVGESARAMLGVSLREKVVVKW
jgi:S-adenosylmethionine hydrolase